jgi:hypothetical protein
MPPQSRRGAGHRQFVRFDRQMRPGAPGSGSEEQAYAAQALIARIIAPMPKMRMTRFRL